MTVRSHLLPAARRGDGADMVHIHPPKTETFDLAARTTTDPKGYVRAVDEYRVAPFGLYVARDMVDHPSITYRESWLLPALGIQVTDWYFRDGHERDQDFYIDVAIIQSGEHTWHLVDLYLDIVLRTGRGLRVLDTDELLAAATEGHIDARTARSAIETSHAVVDRLASHGYDLGAWLADLDMDLTWRRR